MILAHVGKKGYNHLGGAVQFLEAHKFSTIIFDNLVASLGSGSAFWGRASGVG